jgi:hypothetical protein
VRIKRVYWEAFTVLRAFTQVRWIFCAFQHVEPSGPVKACNGIALPLPFTQFCKILSHPQGRSAAGRMSMKNSNDTIGNRTCVLPVCSAVPQPSVTKYVYSPYAVGSLVPAPIRIVQI